MTSYKSSDRIENLDILRGFALLGILVMNIAGMGLPRAAYLNPTLAGGSEGADLWFWVLAHVLVDGKMRAIFSLLFGAGAVLLMERLEAKQENVRRIYYRRTLWLILFGILHGNLLWYGDILYGYGICGLLLYPLRRRSARTLIVSGALVLLLNAGMGIGASFAFRQMIDDNARLSATSTLSAEDTKKLTDIRKQLSMFQPTRAEINQEITARRGTLSAIQSNSAFAREFEGLTFLQVFFLDIFGMMLLGMGLGKAGVLAGLRSRTFYLRGAVLGLLIGIPLLAWSAWAWRADGYSVIGFFRYIGTTIDAGRFAVAFAYISLWSLAIQAGALKKLSTVLANVGRMAFTNYILCSVLALLTFSGFGLGLFNQLSRIQLLYVVIPVWAINIAFSQFWLARYPHGPLEWLWRKLTYGAGFR